MNANPNADLNLPKPSIGLAKIIKLNLILL